MILENEYDIENCVKYFNYKLWEFYYKFLFSLVLFIVYFLRKLRERKRGKILLYKKLI